MGGEHVHAGGGLVTRAASLADVGAIAGLLDTCTSALVARRTTGDDVRDRLTLPGTDPALDSAVVLGSQGRSMLGFGHLWPASSEEVRCFARVHPAAVGRGVGSALLDRLELRAAELHGNLAGEVKLTLTTWPGDEGAPELLRARGYTEVRFFQRMRVDLETVAPPAGSSTGATLRAYERGRDDDELLAAYVESFADHWGQSDTDPAVWWRERRDAQSSGFDPGLWLVADREGSIVGFAVARERTLDGERQGYVGDLGVRPAWRGRGIGLALLTRAFGLFRARGIRTVALDVDTENTSGALRLYVKAGMRARPAFTIWGRDLP